MSGRITRKEFLIGAAGMTLAGGLPSTGFSGELPRFPDWAERLIEEGLARFFAWKGADEVFSFALITDTHSKTAGIGDEIDWENSKNHVFFLRAIAHRAGADYIADLGDHDFDGDAKAPGAVETAMAKMEGLAERYRGESLPVLFSLGNHDHANRLITSKEYGRVLCRGVNEGRNFTSSACGSWGYFDFPGKKVRAFYLNSSDTAYEGHESDVRYAGMTREQLQFLADGLASTPDGWQVIVEQHIQIPGVLGRWRRFMDDSSMQREAIFTHILDDFACHRGNLVEGFYNPPRLGAYDGVKWDFSKSKATLIGDFAGHTHVEQYMKLGSLNCVTRPGYGTVPDDCLCLGARDPKGGNVWWKIRKTSMMIDLVAVKTAVRKVRIFRFGQGGAESDLEFGY